MRWHQNSYPAWKTLRPVLIESHPLRLVADATLPAFIKSVPANIFSNNLYLQYPLTLPRNLPLSTFVSMLWLTPFINKPGYYRDLTISLFHCLLLWFHYFDIVFYNFILADKLCAKSLPRFKLRLSVSINSCGKLVATLESQIKFDDSFRVTSDNNFTLTLLYWDNLFS